MPEPEELTEEQQYNEGLDDILEDIENNPEQDIEDDE